MEPTNTTDVPASAPLEHPPKKRRALKILLLIGVFVVAGVAAYAILAAFNNAADDRKPLKVGIIAAFTGGSSTHGHGIAKGVQLAQKELEAQDVEVIQEDSQCDPKVGQEAMQRLIDQDVDVVIGDGCSSVSVAVLPMINSNETPMVSPGASSPALSIPNDYFYRVIPSDRWQGSFMARELYDTGHRRVAVFYTNEPYGSGMNNEFRAAFEELGGEVVATATSEPDVIELEDHIAQLAEANADALFVAPNSVVTGTAVIELARDAGMDVPFYGADIFYDTTIISNAPEASEGLTVSTFATGTQAFKESLAAESPVQEQLFAASQAYDAFEVVYRAYQGGANTSTEYKDAFASMDFEGVSTHIRFNEDGEIDGDGYIYSLLRVEGDKFVEINPR